MDIKATAGQFRQEAKRLLDAANLIDPIQTNSPTVVRITGSTRKRTGARRMTAALRKKLSDAQQRRRARERGESIQEPQAA